jgi:hypothetical protein
MRHPLRTAIALAVAGSVVAGAAALAAAIPIYTNDMSTAGKRSQVRQLGGGHCARSGQAKTLKVRIGKATRECDFRTPVVGGSLEISATERLLSGTPASIRARTFIAVGLRVGHDGQYQLAVFPQKGSFQLRRDAPPDGTRSLLAHGESAKVKNINQANKLRLQAFATDTDEVRLTAFVNGRKLASVTEAKDAAAKLSGRFSTVSVGSAKAAKGAAASFDDLTVAVPDPF